MVVVLIPRDLNEHGILESIFYAFICLANRLEYVQVIVCSIFDQKTARISGIY